MSAIREVVMVRALVAFNYLASITAIERLGLTEAPRLAVAAFDPAVLVAAFCAYTFLALRVRGWHP